MDNQTSVPCEKIDIDLHELFVEFNPEISNVVVSGLPEGVFLDLESEKIAGQIMEGSGAESSIVSIEFLLNSGDSVIESFTWTIETENLGFIPDQFSVLNDTVKIDIGSLLSDGAYVKVTGLPEGIIYKPKALLIEGIASSIERSKVDVSVIYLDGSAETLFFEWNVFEKIEEIKAYNESIGGTENVESDTCSEGINEIVEVLSDYNHTDSVITSSKIALRDKLKNYGFYAVLLCLAMLAFYPSGKEVVASGKIVPSNVSYFKAPYDGVIAKYYPSNGDRVEKGQPIFEYGIGNAKKDLETELSSLRGLKIEYDDLFAKYTSDKNESYMLLLSLSQSSMSQKQKEISELYSLLEDPIVYAETGGYFYLDSKGNKKGDFVRQGEHVAAVSLGDEFHVEANLSLKDVSVLGKIATAEFIDIQGGEVVSVNVETVEENTEASSHTNYPFKLIASLKSKQSSLSLGDVGRLEISEGYIPFISTVF